MNTPQWITTAAVKDGALSTHQRLYFLDLLKQEMTDHLDTEYGTGNWLMLPTDELPADFSTETYTVIDGRLVPANTEVLDARAAVKAKAAAEVEIAELKQYLADTDYCVIKAAEAGAPMAELYPEQHTRRTEARARINELEQLTQSNEIL